MSWSAAVGAVGAVAGGYLSSKGAGDAADAQSAGADAAAQVQWDMYDQTRTDLEPYRSTGTQANSLLQASLGGDTTAFKQSPGYQFAFDEGQRAVDSSGAARGMSLSGAQLKSLSKYGQGMANQEYGNWFNRTFDLARLGQNSATQTGAAGTSAAGNAGNALMAAGNARGSGYINQANAWGNALQGVAGAAGDILGRR